MMSVPAARSLWVTRVQLPSELAQSVNQRDGGGTVVAVALHGTSHDGNCGSARCCAYLNTDWVHMRDCCPTKRAA